MTTEREKQSITYSRIVTNLMALREEVRGTSSEEAKALDRMVSELVALQMYDRYTAGNGIPGAGK
jgi:hypothetical protein